MGDFKEIEIDLGTIPDRKLTVSGGVSGSVIITFCPQSCRDMKAAMPEDDDSMAWMPRAEILDKLMAAINEIRAEPV